MARPEKEKTVKEIEEKIDNAKVTVVADFTGLNVHQISKMRELLKEQDAEYKVFKNTLIKIATKNKSLEGLDKLLKGSTALAFGYNDEITTPKILFKFFKEHGGPKIKGGILEGEVIDSSQIKNLANLPSFEELLAKLMGSMQAPLSGFANVLSGPIRGLVTVLDGITKQKASKN
ncbi:50S ribosomal protein L10 [Candidatus Oleimmundimicrobium sp.]|uniref:50S ribosomal protein L10 n=1 Tax=Candidatus Oleimmundimicrobium sp. TaxID=3060597 RepID=UPI00272137AD|nr:50S ribosomal protein L10 [Candidatus Oleimmundimicrobium sp.]MDO8885951.1 50S ribosomal protein L10 [Candidatus Oleimmundimicrobium sp.]